MTLTTERLHPPKRRTRRWLIGCIVLLLFGIGIRGFHLDHKVYWHDEVYTSFNIAGYARSEVISTLFTDQPIGVEDLQAVQQPTPERGIPTLLTVMGREDNQHPPLYYIVLRLWVNLFGNSITAIRSLSVLFSLLMFPALYWLCLELFGSARVGWMAIALVAVSPFHLLYAQEAREYAMWGTLIIATTALFLKAIRSPSWQNWALYGLGLLLSCYTFLFSGLVAIAHGLYLLLTQHVIQRTKTGWRISDRALGYGAALSIVSVLLLPWIATIARYYEITKMTSAWTKVPIPVLTLFQIWSYNITRLLVDFDFDPARVESTSFYALIALALALTGYALYFLCRHTPKFIWTMVLLLVGSTTLILMLPDLILGGQRSTSPRYMVPSWVGIELAIAYLLAQKSQVGSRLQRRVWSSILTMVLVLGVLSDLSIAQSETWWTKSVSYALPRAARIINESDRPLILSDSYAINIGNVVALSYRVDPDTTFLLMREVGQGFTVPDLSLTDHTVFLYDLPQPFLAAFQAKYHKPLTPIFQDLWVVSDQAS